MHPKTHRLIFIVVFIFIFMAKNLKADFKELYPSALMKHETQWLIKVLEQAHYNKLKIQELDATSFINEFVNKLDKQKLYFTKKEVEIFHSVIVNLCSHHREWVE